MIAGVLVVAMVGTAVGIDWDDLLAQLTRERHQGKEACFIIRNDPRQSSYISWAVGASADRFQHPKFGRYNRCHPAETGEKVGLFVEKTVPGTTTCSIVQIPDNITIGPERTAEGMDACSTGGVVV